MVATIDDLPTEVFHSVLDQLGCDGGLDALSACTLVCRRWLDVSQQHLFSELCVLRGCDESFDNFAEFLETHRTHAGYIRTLSLEARLFSMPPRTSLMPSLTSGLLLRIVRALSNPHGLRLRQLKIIPPAPDTDGASPPHPARFSIEHMEYEKCLTSVAHTFELLSMFQMDHLDFDPLFQDVVGERTNVQLGDRRLDVRSLCVSPEISQPAVAFEALQQVVPPNMLRSFRYPSLGVHPAVNFLRGVGQNIVDLNLCPTSTDDHTVLPLLPSLRVFRYHPGVALLASEPASLKAQQCVVAPFRERWLPHLPADLEQLALYITYGDDEDGGGGRVAAPGPGSMPLWGFELALARFRALRKLSIYFPPLSECALKCAAPATAACFPACHAAGILEVEVRVWALECRDWDIYGYLRDC